MGLGPLIEREETVMRFVSISFGSIVGLFTLSVVFILLGSCGDNGSTVSDDEITDNIEPVDDVRPVSNDTVADGNEEIELVESLARGRTLYADYNCSTCHGDKDRVGIGPALDRWGERVNLDDGSLIVVDSEYVAESIRLPSAKLRYGYSDKMPGYDFNDSEMKDILFFIASLNAK